jgi:hypothetical protein
VCVCVCYTCDSSSGLQLWNCSWCYRVFWCSADTWWEGCDHPKPAEVHSLYWENCEFRRSVILWCPTTSTCSGDHDYHPILWPHWRLQWVSKDCYFLFSFHYSSTSRMTQIPTSLSIPMEMMCSRHGSVGPVYVRILSHNTHIAGHITSQTLHTLFL